ncbi:LAFE_0G02124g1_1 [Lachancea fermentati]|uniref:Transcription initiation factor TFIID subunit 2 n=1 Tax=Lachancea fermentati TaxID=4955 RepID=A0A1G4MGM4_LACFM|nr:LAFE_0G02124g1_1 [Lachancea fermentati]
MAITKGTPRGGGSSQPFTASPESAFKVAHQRVSIDVDLSTHSVSGMTEIILIPLSDRLEYVTLDCKEISVNGVIVENRRCDHFIHDDPFRWYADKYTKGELSDNVLYNYNSVEQSHFLRNKFAELNHASEITDSSRSQLTIKIPSSVKITLQDPNSLSSFTPITPSIRTPAQDAIYSPISIRVNFELHNPINGVLFDTTKEQYLWNAFTTNSEWTSSASHWVPCVDSLAEKCTWELEFSVPKKVRDIGTTKVVGASQPKKRKRELNSFEEEDEDEEEEEEEEDNPMNRDIVVCCSEFSSGKEAPHPTDLSRKVVSFQIFNPVAPHHIGWAVGAFQLWTLPQINYVEEQEEEQDEATINEQQQDDDERDVIPVQIYTLPSPDIDERTVLNSTLVCQEIIDFYSKEFGSYPFTSFSLLFLPSLPDSTMDFAATTFCNTRLLYPPEMIDPIFSTTDALAWTLASQWSGINITPAELNDVWCTIGMAGYMSLQFSKKLMGVNEFKYRVKRQSEMIVEQDWEKPPIASTFDNASMPLSTTCRELEFVKLKSPIVLFILDRRMTKTERSFGMSRVLPKIFLQAMSGDLPNNCLSSAHFQHVCERVNKSKLEQFFKEWVYGSGAPIFRITQRFNKKRMVVEMGIRQCQVQELGQNKTIGVEGFHSSAMNYLCHKEKSLTPVFTGSITIRIHEADGTPYEHIVEIKDAFTKLDIQYNTKYKRLKRRRKINKSAKQEGKDQTPIDNNEAPPNEEENEDVVLVNCLGDVLLGAKDCSQWNLTDALMTSEGDEFQQQNEAFEWIRIDSDFEWICKIHINQPDYMFASQLQQDRDVEAQIDSVRFFEDVIVNSNVNSLVYSSILTRTIMDERYFYGVRVEACRALSKFVWRDSQSPQFYGGAMHLIKIFQHFFCYKDSNIPLNNNFCNYQKYFLQKCIPKYLAEVKNENGYCPNFVKKFLLDILRYNENSENCYNDTYYVVVLIGSLVTSAIQDKNDTSFVKDLLHELQRFENLDQWIPSYQLLVTKSIMLQHLRLAVDDLYVYEDLSKVLEFTIKSEANSSLNEVTHMREGLQDLVLSAFKVLLIGGGIKNKEGLKYFFEFMSFHPDPYIRIKLVDVLIDAINFISVRNSMTDLDDDIEGLTNAINPEIENGSIEFGDPTSVREPFSVESSNRREAQLRTSIHGVITLVRRKFAKYEPLKQIIWDALHSPLLNVYQKKRLFDLTRVIYKLVDGFCVTLPIPRDKKLVARDMGSGKVKIRREGILKVHLAPKVKITTKAKTSVPPVPSKPSSKVKINLSNAKRPATPVKQRRAAPQTSIASPVKGKQTKGAVLKVGSLPLRYVRITENKKVDLSAVPFNNNVSIIRSNARSLMIKFKLPESKRK